MHEKIGYKLETFEINSELKDGDKIKFIFG
jgi:hypothetical protein